MYKTNSSGRKSNVASKTNAAEGSQNTYVDHGGGNPQVPESKYPGNQVKHGSYKPESTGTTPENTYKDY